MLSSAIWIGLTFLFATQNYIVLNANGRDTTYAQMLIREYPVWLAWWVLVPFLFAFVRAYPLGSGRWHNLVRYVPVMIGFAILNLSILAAIRYLYRSPEDIKSLFEFWKRYQMGAFGQVFSVQAVIIAIYYGVHYFRAYQRRELVASQLETELSRAQLNVLRMQIQPHFLFNTLHSISALMETDVKAARRMIAQFSDLIRVSLDEDASQEIPLEEEVQFLKRYLSIQEMRFQDRLTVEFAIQQEALPVLVPRLLLQPLVENALKHGIARQRGQGIVTIEATVNNGKLMLRVQDNGPGLGGHPVREGIGLRNTRARLEKLYGAVHCFDIEEQNAGGVSATIELPISVETKQISP